MTLQDQDGSDGDADLVRTDEVLDSAALLDCEQVTEPSSFAAAPGTQPTPRKLKSVPLLVLCEPTDRAVDPFIRFILKKQPSAESRIRVRSHAEFVQTLQQYSSISQLVLVFEGTSGGSIAIGGVQKDWSLIIKMIASQAPRVDRMEFEACNVGRGLARVTPFARRLGATKVSGWNLFWATPREPFKIVIKAKTPTQDATTPAEVKQALAPIADYLMPGQFRNEGDLASRPGTHLLWYEWFMGPPAQGALPPIGSRDGFYPRSSQKPPRSITSDEADAVQNDYEAEMAGPPKAESPLQRIEMTVVPEMGGR